jgi:nitroreductase
MTFSELAKNRFSVRKFSNQPVEEEKLAQILETGRIAPTAKNLQPQRIYVLKSPEALDKIRKITVCAFDAPIVLLVCGDVQNSWKSPFNGQRRTEMDCAIVTTHMMMQAWELGIGSVWVCRFDTELTKTAFALPEGIEPFCLLPIGYAAFDCVPAAFHAIRKPLGETVTVL